MNLSTRKTRKRELLDEMNRVVPWAVLIALIEPHYPKGKTERQDRPPAVLDLGDAAADLPPPLHRISASACEIAWVAQAAAMLSMP